MTTATFDIEEQERLLGDASAPAKEVVRAKGARGCSCIQVILVIGCILAILGLAAGFLHKKHMDRIISDTNPPSLASYLVRLTSSIDGKTANMTRHDKWIVITSIHMPTDAIHRLAGMLVGLDCVHSHLSIIL